MRRAVLLKDAADMLKKPYTYDIIVKEATKRDARMQLGMMAAEIIEIIAEEMRDASVRTYIRAGDTERTERQAQSETQAPQEESSKER